MIEITHDLKDKLEDLCNKEILEKITPILLEIISAHYIAGYRQGKFDVTMDISDQLMRIIADDF